MSRKEVLRVSHFSNSSGESLLIFCTTGSKVPQTGRDFTNCPYFERAWVRHISLIAAQSALGSNIVSKEGAI